MKRKMFLFLSAVMILVTTVAANSEPQQITLKFATLAPSGTFANSAINSMQKCFDMIGPTFNIKVNVKGYYGGVMGDDPQMIQKARMGQLDMLATTLNGLPLIAKELELFNMAYLIEDFGMFDYIMRRNAPLINKLFYDNGWISLGLLISEGEHDLYLTKPLRTVNELKGLKAVNYTGGPDDTFFKALGIPQTHVGPSEIYTSAKTGVINAALLPSAFVIGMQIYTCMPYIISPSVRVATSALMMSRKSWEKLPWDFRIYMATLQPGVYYAGAGIVRDASYAFKGAMLKQHCKEVKLSDAEFKEWSKYIEGYRKTFIGDDPKKSALYKEIVDTIKEYKTTNPIEKRMFLSDPTYKNFPDKIQRIGDALVKLMKTKDKSVVLKLDTDNILERWRVYDSIEAMEHYKKTGDNSKIKKWMKGFYIPEVVDEIFTKHFDIIKKLYSTEKAMNERMSEAAEAYKIGQGMYKGYQRNGLTAK